MAAGKQAIKNIPLVRCAGRGIKNRIRDIKAISCLLSCGKKKEGKIKVGFFCQYIPAWTKVEPLYRQMLEDPRFEPYLLCLPSGIANGELIDPHTPGNDTYDYFLAQGYTDAIDTRLENNQWLDLRSLGLSYIFYPRPYNPLVPKCYSSHLVSKYCRICMIMYGIATTKEITKITLNRDFMADVYYYFAESAFAREVNIKNNRLGHWLKLQHSLCLGVPVLEQFSRSKDTPSPSWDFSKNQFRAIWAPRWTTDKAEGGSNFFTYWQALPQYAKEHPDADFLFRPHPLTFPHFLQTGEMTQQQVEDFKALCASMPNLRLDQQGQYEATFWGSTVLISDISAIIPEYFTTGKPLIFCASNMELELADFMEEMITGCYVVNDQQELFACLDQLRRGNDPLYQKRQELIPKLFGQSSDQATARILDALAK